MATLTEQHGAAVGAADALKILTAAGSTASVAAATPIVAAALGTVLGQLKVGLSTSTAETAGINVSFDAPTSAALLAALPQITSFLAANGVTL